MAVACVLGPQELSTVNVRAVKVIYTHVHTGRAHTDIYTIDIHASRHTCLQIKFHMSYSSCTGAWGYYLGDLQLGCWQHIKNYNQ